MTVTSVAVLRRRASRRPRVRRRSLAGGPIGQDGGMDLTYPPEAEAFRAEIRAWLEENLPDGWFDAGLRDRRPRRRRSSTRSGPTKLFEGGWICATWPTEYGGKGLSTMEAVVLAEEFARAGAPMRADFFGDTLVGPTILQWGTEEQKKDFLPEDPLGRDRLVPGLHRARRRLRPRLPQDQGRARRRRVGHQRPEDLDHPGLRRRLHLRPLPHRSGRVQAQGHLVPARAR